MINLIYIGNVRWKQETQLPHLLFTSAADTDRSGGTRPVLTAESTNSAVETDQRATVRVKPAQRLAGAILADVIGWAVGQ